MSQCYGLIAVAGISGSMGDTATATAATTTTPTTTTTTTASSKPATPAKASRPSRDRKQVEVYKPPTEGDSKKKEIAVVEGSGLTLGDYAYFNDQWVRVFTSIQIHYIPCCSEFVIHYVSS